MYEIIGVSIGVGFLRGIRGFLKNKKEPFSWKRFGSTILVCGALGSVFELSTLYAGLGPVASLAASQVSAWLGTDIVEDIIQK